MIDNGDEQTEMSTATNGSGSIDVANERAMETQTITTDFDGIQSEQELSTYVVNDTIYMSGLFGPESEWVQMNLSDDEMTGEMDFELFDQLAQYQALASVSDVEVTGEETVDGTETTVVTFAPNWEEYVAMVEEDLATNGDATGLAAEDAEMNEDELEEFSDAFDVTITMWIDEETGLPVKVVTETHVCLTGEDLAGADDEAIDGFEQMTVTGTNTIYFDDYNEDVTIELPSDAENAVNFDELLGNMSEYDDAELEENETVDEEMTLTDETTDNESVSAAAADC
ncbi:hypothetical protein ACNS7O_14995 (plasmid) [Haloferacaceae archaeon DSL9]